MARKSYWQSCFVDSDDAKDTVKSWFPVLSEGMTPYKAEILCDVETDAEKKLRAFMTDDENRRFVFTRTKGKRFTISMCPIEAQPPVLSPESVDNPNAKT